MSLASLLTMPWYGLRRSMRILWVLLTVCCWVVAAACAYIGAAKGWVGAAAVLAFWLVLIGLMLGTSLLPAYEARQLRLPRVERAAVLSVVLNSVVLIALTGIPLAMFSPHPARVFELLVTGLAAGLAYGLWPILWVIGLGMSPALLQGLASVWHWRPVGLLAPHLGQVCAAGVAVALGGAAWNWRRVLRSAGRTPPMTMRPLVLAFRAGAQGGWFQRGATSVDPTAVMARQTPGWLRPEADLRDAGPRNRRRALRVLLGGFYLPVTRASLARQLSVALVAIAFVAVLNLPNVLDHGWHWFEVRPLLLVTMVFMLSWVGLAGALMRSMHLVRRWGRPGGELAVLGLLPGLGVPREQAALLLRTLFGALRHWHVPLILAALVLARLDGIDRLRTLVLLVTLGLAPLGEAAALYCTVGCCRVPKWTLWALSLVGLVIFNAGLAVGVHLGSAVLPRPELTGALLSADALCYAGLLTLAARGRYAQRRLPHPYLGLS